ncbi:hypothetical protein QY895_04045 [Latilactobacillus sakei]
MRDLKEWSQIGQQLADQGTPLFCPKCNFNLKGERFCPNCNTKIVYPGENSNDSINKMIKFGDRMNKVGNSMSNFGTSMTIGCTIPVLIIILIILFL